MQQFSSGHKDLVLAIAYNLYGNRMTTAGADHMLKVWHKDDKTQDWHLVDTWLAHDAEVTDVKWTPPYLGEHIGSIGEDGLFKLWREDINQAPNSTRRFIKVFSMTTSTGVPYMSLDFKSIGTELYLAVITRHGYLHICEPDDTSDLSAWKTTWSDYMCKTPPRTEETGFRLSWHKEKLPAWPAIYAGLDRKSLSLAVAVSDTVRIFRTDKDRKFYNACQLEGAKELIRDIDWANGSMRGFDTIATASKDGFIRIYELHTPGNPSQTRMTESNASTPAIRPIRSGIGAGLASGARGKRDDDHVLSGAIKQEARLVAELDSPGTPWRVTWSFAGDVLVSTGDDGMVRMWKKSIEGKWLEALEIDAVGD